MIVVRSLLLEKPKERREKQTESAIRFSKIVTDLLLKTRPREHDRYNKKSSVLLGNVLRNPNRKFKKQISI
jgi:hypothetical protein